MAEQPAQIVGWDVEIADANTMLMRLELKIPHLTGSAHQQAGALSLEDAQQLVWDLTTKIDAIKTLRAKIRRPPV
jgi:hypothetical protein